MSGQELPQSTATDDKENVNIAYSSSSKQLLEAKNSFCKCQDEVIFRSITIGVFAYSKDKNTEPRRSYQHTIHLNLPIFFKQLLNKPNTMCR